MKIVQKWQRNTGRPYLAVQIEDMTAEQLCEILLTGLHTKESKYTQVLTKIDRTNKYYRLAQQILDRTRSQIVSIESAQYDYLCRMEDKLNKGEMTDDERD